ncbi:hypothetical protein ABZ215_13840 [Amycolatopsis sp. NPDC006131]|uniref:hypothetical protein n=1 Tax=Amycolatopsis sp. NPDC006131 TaxID=3156731 RepID=UPI0033B3293B
MAGQDWKRLGSFVARKRFEMGYETPIAFAEAISERLGDISDRTLTRLENGTRVGRTTLLKVETFFGWDPGMIDRILAGGTPPEYNRAASAPTAASDEPDLQDEVERKLWAISELSEEDRLTYIQLHRARHAAHSERRRKG